jgi:hypothetical protein
MSKDDEAQLEVRLLAVFRVLDAQDRHALQPTPSSWRCSDARSVAVERIDDVAAASPQPEARPEGESVVMAIKRLTRTYPMIDRRKLMGPTSLLMSQHALQGRAATEVIDELEVVFERHYRETAGRET